METAVTATPAIAPAAFSAVSLAGLESATNRSHLEMPRLHIAAFFFWVTLHLEISAWTFVACEGVCREKAFLCANSVVLGVSVVELLKKTLTTEAQRSHRGPQRRILRQTPKQAPA